MMTAYFPLSLPPGVYRNGTEFESKGRYYDASLIRWIDRDLRPIGGWQKRSVSQVTGAARAIQAWRDNSGATWLGIATHSHLYASNRAGDIYDITPTGFVVGRSDAVTGGGYGMGDFGVGFYGTPRPDNTLIQDATVCTLDTWGQNLLMVSPDDGKIYEWALNTASPAAAVANAPSCKALVVTPERFVLALGAANDQRNVAWCDQEDNTDWTPTTTNQAGSFPLQTAGSLMCGKVIQGGTLLFTDVDAWLAAYTADTLVYRFTRVGSACGVVSRQCVAALDARAVWMGRNSFWLYNGYVQPLACEVADYVFSDINSLQLSKIYAVRNSAFDEIEWHYCSSGSNEIDRCVIWNYRDNYWNIGRPSRLCGTDRGVFQHPIMIDADGYLYDHEVGFNYDGDIPYAESGPVEIGNGDQMIYADQLIPDERTAGQVTITLTTRQFPNGAASVHGPYALASPTNVRITGRQAKMRYTAAMMADWRVGSPRLAMSGGGRR